MDWMGRMNASVQYLEAHLCDGDAVEGAARRAQCSVYNFQRLFGFIAGLTPAAYLRARRLTLAALELQREDGARILDVALKWGYDSHDSFTRAFRAFHGILPSQVRGARLTFVPPISFSLTVKGGTPMQVKIEHRPACILTGYFVPVPISQNEVFSRAPAFWQEAAQTGRIARLCGIARFADACPPGLLGAYVPGPEGGAGRYFAAVTTWMDAPGWDPIPLPDDMTSVRVPAADWAVIDAAGDPEESVQEAIRRYWSEWLPASNFEPMDLPQIECYLNPESTVQQVCFPIRRAG